MEEDATSSAMAANGFRVDADEQDLAAHRQNMALLSIYLHVYSNTALTIGVPVPDHDPLLGSPSVNVMVQVPSAGDTLSPQSAAVSFQLALSADELMVAGPPVTQETEIVREVEIGPGITLGYHSLDDYKFMTSLLVIEEEH